MRKFLKRAAITAIATIGSFVGIGHLSSQILKATSPTPEDFALSERGKPYGAKATNILKSHDDIIVLKPDSFAFKAYKYTHPLFWIGYKLAKLESAFSSTPTQFLKVLGQTNLVVMNGIDHTTPVEGLDPEETKISRDLAFSVIMFHELGHQHHFKKMGKASHALPIVDQELYGDSYQLDALSEEFNGATRPYTLHMRAFALFDQTHDTLPYLFKNAGFPPQPIDEEKRNDYLASGEALSSILIDCLTPDQVSKSMKNLEGQSQSFPPGLYKAFYECLKPHQSVMKNHAADFNPADRAVHFIQAYEYFIALK